MPRERLDKRNTGLSSGGIYADLSALIALQFEVSGAGVAPSKPVQSLLTGRFRSRIRGRGLDFEEVRTYVYGDDIRNIDWKVTARMKTPQTRVYTEEKERPVFLIVDQSATMFFGTRTRMKSFAAAEVAALAAWKVFAVKDRLGGVVFNDQEASEIPPRYDRQNIQRFLSIIVKKNKLLCSASFENSHPEMLDQVLKRTINTAKHDFLIVVISDFYGFNPVTHRLMSNLTRHNDMILIQVYDPMEEKLPDGDIVLGSGQMQLAVSRNDKDLREAFSKRSGDLTQSMKSLVSSNGMTLIKVSTAEPVQDQLQLVIKRNSKKTGRNARIR